MHIVTVENSRPPFYLPYIVPTLHVFHEDVVFWEFAVDDCGRLLGRGYHHNPISIFWNEVQTPVEATDATLILVAMRW